MIKILFMIFYLLTSITFTACDPTTKAGAETNSKIMKLDTSHIPDHVRKKLKPILEKALEDKILFEFLVVGRGRSIRSNSRYKIFTDEYSLEDSNSAEADNMLETTGFFTDAYPKRRSKLDEKAYISLAEAFETLLAEYPEDYYEKDTRGGSFFILRWMEKDQARHKIFNAFPIPLHDLLYEIHEE